MAEAAGNSAGHDPAESLIDDLIRDILSEPGQATKARARSGDPLATLIETAIASAPRTEPKAATMEKLLIAQLFASTLADALAPALAEILAPEIMKALEQHTSDSRAPDQMASTAGPAKGGRRKT